MRTVTININKRCPLKCKHCSIGFSDSYRGEEQVINPQGLTHMIESVDTQVYSMVLLAGGEPSLSPHLIRVAIAACKNFGLRSAIVTAPVWARTAVTAKGFLSKIADLDILILSYDIYHLEFLTLHHYINATLEGIKRGIGVVFQITYSRDDEKEAMTSSLGGMRVLATQINPVRAVRVGKALQANLQVDELEVKTVFDLARIPRGCILGNAFIDEQFGVHGCCWSTAAEQSPFSIRASDGPASLGLAFKQLEGNPVFHSVRERGLIDALTVIGREAVVEVVSGERFSCECELCIRMMKRETQHIWERAYLVGPGDAYG